MSSGFGGFGGGSVGGGFLLGLMGFGGEYFIGLFIFQGGYLLYDFCFNLYGGI